MRSLYKGGIYCLLEDASKEDIGLPTVSSRIEEQIAALNHQNSQHDSLYLTNKPPAISPRMLQEAVDLGVTLRRRVCFHPGGDECHRPSNFLVSDNWIDILRLREVIKSDMYIFTNGVRGVKTELVITTLPKRLGARHSA
jgi:hypothetical protein